VPGVQFALWAPNARSVARSVIFKQNWDGRHHPMQNGWAGIWELFIPAWAVAPSTNYEVAAPEGPLLPGKADPYGFSA